MDSGEVQNVSGLAATSVDDSEPVSLFWKSIHIKSIRLLVEQGADIEMTEYHGESYLMRMLSESSLNAHYDTLNYLLNVGARVNRRQDYGTTVLHCCMQEKELNILIRKGAFLRKNENGESVIINAALKSKLEILQYLCRHTSSDQTTMFVRRCNITRYVYPSDIDLQEQICAYKLIGAWSTALEMCEKTEASSRLAVKRTPSCIFCMQESSVEADSGSKVADANDCWTEFRLTSRKMVTGKELLERVRKRCEQSWMPNFLPCLHFPTCPPGHLVPSLVYQSVEKCSKRRGFGKIYLEKMQHLHTELQSLYKHEERLLASTKTECVNLLTNAISFEKCVRLKNRISLRTGRLTRRSFDCCSIVSNIHTNDVSIEPSSMSDAILGVEPTCFVETGYHHNDVAPRSYHLHRQWLIARLATPRTNYRCLYKVCTACGHMFIQFGELQHRRSEELTLSMVNKYTQLVCKRCVPSRGNSKQSMPNTGYYSYRFTTTETRTAGEINTVVHNQTAAVKFCQYCDLVLQHPLLQRLWKCCKEVFGDIREVSTWEELEKCMSNRSDIRLQNLLIKLRYSYPPNEGRIMDLIDEHASAVDIRASLNVWNFAVQYVNTLYFCGSVIDLPLKAFRTFNYSILKNEGYIVDPCLIVDYLEVAVDYINRSVGAEYTLMFTSDFAMQLASLLLLHYPTEVSFKRSSLQGQCLIDLVSKKYYALRNSGETYVSPSQCRKILIKDTCVSACKDITHFTEETLSLALLHRFISQVYRMVCLDNEKPFILDFLSYAMAKIPDDHNASYRIIAIVSLLLQLGADPKSIGYVVMRSRYQTFVTRYISKALLDGVDHFYANNQSLKAKQWDLSVNDKSRKNSICLPENRKLACLAATTLQCNVISSRCLEFKDHLPKHMLSFLNLH